MQAEELFQELLKTFMNGAPLLYKAVGVLYFSLGIVAGSYGNMGLKVVSPLISGFGVLSYGFGKELEWQNETAYKEML